MRQSLSRTIRLPDPAATETLGRHLAGRLPDVTDGWMLLLQGDLGAGKSTLARAMLAALGHEGAAPSPTYTLVEPYDLPGGTVYHVDLYRISDENEVPYLGWDDLCTGLVLIEWPERVPSLTAQADLHIRLGFEGAGREATVTALRDRAAALLQKLPAGLLA